MNIQYRVQSQGQMLIQFLAPLLSLSLRSCSQPLRLNFFILWNEIFLAISVGKKCHSHQWFQGSKREWGLPKGNTMPAIQIQQMPPSRTVTAHELGGMQEAAIHHIYHSLRWTRNEGGKQETESGPRIAEVHMKGMTQRGQRLASSHTQKNAKFLSLISGFPYLTIISDVQTACLLCYKLLYSLTPSPASSGLLRCCLWSLESLTFPPSRITLYFQVVTNFLFYKYVQLEH